MVINHYKPRFIWTSPDNILQKPFSRNDDQWYNIHAFENEPQLRETVYVFKTQNHSRYFKSWEMIFHNDAHCLFF